MSRDEGWRQLRAGLFLTGAMAVLVLAVFLIGRTQTLFAHRLRLHTEFENTGGLVVGAPVRLAGVDVGVVEAIRFDRDLAKQKVEVTLAVDRRFSDRVRADSLARLTSKGLLGDVIVDITVGSAEAPTLPDGATVRAQERQGLNEIVASLQQAIEEVRKLAAGVGERMHAVFNDQVARDLGRVAHSAADVAEQIEHGDGLAHTLLYDRELSREARQLVRGAVAAVDHVDALLTDIGGSASATLSEIQRDARQIGAVAEAIRSGHGILHTLVYEPDGGNLVENLSALAKTLRRIGDEVEQGKGTVGALLKDPSVYEDLKGIVGSVERSRVLRSLIRSTIRKHGLRATEAP
jgi:phospholipid/cholesterol/gamma-HCH transport system substrate-binding protein